MSEWIDVKEKLPLSMMEVLVNGFAFGKDGGDRFTAIAVLIDGEWWLWNADRDNYTDRAWPPTHWMALPEPPVQSQTSTEQTLKSKSELTHDRI